jgi:hypothetical protein
VPIDLSDRKFVSISFGLDSFKKKVLNFGDPHHYKDKQKLHLFEVRDKTLIVRHEATRALQKLLDATIPPVT